MNGRNGAKKFRRAKKYLLYVYGNCPELLDISENRDTFICRHNWYGQLFIHIVWMKIWMLGDVKVDSNLPSHKMNWFETKAITQISTIPSYGALKITHHSAIK